MSGAAFWEQRTRELEREMVGLRNTMMAMVAGAGGRIVIDLHDRYALPGKTLHRYTRPESGAEVFELRLSELQPNSEPPPR